MDGTVRVGVDLVEVVNGPFGRPSVRPHGEAAARAERHGLTDLDLSLTHSPALAMAGAVTTWAPTRGRPLPPGWAADEGPEG
jgi:phosphopantetheinyl transferase (holo-ACP synthase)